MNTPKTKYNSVTSIAFTVYHNQEDGEDITNESLMRDLLMRLSDVALNEGLLEATGGDLSDTQLEEERTPKNMYLNQYRCTHCQTEWEFTHDSQCEDDCATCGTVWTPHNSEQLLYRT